MSAGWDRSDDIMVYSKHSERIDAVHLSLSVTMEFDGGIICKRSLK